MDLVVDDVPVFGDVSELSLHQLSKRSQYIMEAKGHYRTLL